MSGALSWLAPLVSAGASIYGAYSANQAGKQQQQAAQQAWQMGEQQRQIERERVTAQLQEFLRTQPEYSPIVEQVLNYLGLSQQYYAPEGPGWGLLGGLMQGAASGATAAAAA